MHCKLHHAHGDVVPSGLDFEAAGGSVVRVQLFASRASSCCKQDMGALSWLNVETPERAPSLADL